MSAKSWWRGRRKVPRSWLTRRRATGRKSRTSSKRSRNRETKISSYLCLNAIGRRRGASSSLRAANPTSSVLLIWRRSTRRVEVEGRSLVIEKRGSPRAVLLSIRDYVRLAVPEPEVLRILGQESKRKGTSRLGAKQVDQIIKAARKSKRR